MKNRLFHRKKFTKNLNFVVLSALISSTALIACQKMNAKETPAKTNQNQPAALSSDTLINLQRFVQVNPILPTTGKGVIDPDKPTIVKFWASWCPLCLATLQQTNDWTKQYPNMNVISVASPSQLSEKPLSEFQQWYKVIAKDYPNLPVLLDNNGTLIKQFGIQVYPSYAILDKKGNLLTLIKGNLSQAQIQVLADNASNDFAELKTMNTHKMNNTETVQPTALKPMKNNGIYYQADGKTPIRTHTIYLAGGCFWGLEAYFERVEGVVDAVSGYANGKTTNPSYEDVIAGSGHAETVKVTYDMDKTNLATILAYYVRVINPTSLNQQGNDKGKQYRTGIYYTDANDKAVVDKTLAELAKKYNAPIQVENQSLGNFYEAENYHQDYLSKHPDGYCHIDISLANDKIPMIKTDN